MTNVLILGAKGTLGGQLRKLYPEAVAWDREDADVTNFVALAEKIIALDPAPEAIINCVAFNDVDGAEENKSAAVALNTRTAMESCGPDSGTRHSTGALQHELCVRWHRGRV